MFNLKRIVNGRINVSEPIVMASGVSTQTTFDEGTAVAFVAGVLAPISGDATAEYVVAKTTECAAAEDKVPLILVTKDMIFEAPLSETPTEMKVAGKYTLDGGNSVTATPVTDGFGAYVVDTMGAAKTGDTVLVRLA